MCRFLIHVHSVLCVSPLIDKASTQLLRGYPCRQERSKPTVIQAVLACCAAPNYLDPVTIGPPRCQEYLTSAKASSILMLPIAIKEASGQFNSEKPFCCALSVTCERNLASEEGSNLREQEHLVAFHNKMDNLQGFNLSQALDILESPSEQSIAQVSDYLNQASILSEIDNCANALERVTPATISDIGMCIDSPS